MQSFRERKGRRTVRSRNVSRRIGRRGMAEMLSMDYPERAALHSEPKYFDEYDKEELLSALKKAYAQFDGGDAAPLVKVENGMYMLELFHGPTCAFKDVAAHRVALSAPKRMRPSRRRGGNSRTRRNERRYGKGGFGGIQRRQRASRLWSYIPTTAFPKCRNCRCAPQLGDNVNVVAVKGNFDDCQTAVKRIFNSDSCRDKLKEKGILLSSANSINFGRLAPQIAYYFSAYLDLVSSDQIAMGDKVDFAVPTGNFGNILAAY